ncbi:myeloid leukemia factor 2 isoform X2 [Gallus gallus]|uniref:Myeloid leukemia factor 2 n=1 Tax=Gallus gallus TaxID=9031 RepID=A0A8V0ZKD3_CHICK|nr:myeloid leukemia factor 2 isoform X2 [Gallus gallus]XP_046763704.1 myeloid leukemia factor 2 isoform X2 [Gallus gallus]
MREANRLERKGRAGCEPPWESGRERPASSSFSSSSSSFSCRRPLGTARRACRQGKGHGRDPFAIHRQHMNRMLSGSFGFGPLLGITDGTTPGARQAGRRMQAGAVSPFGMLGMAGGFIDMFGMMNDMIGNMEHMTSGANCQTFTSSTVISYSNLGDGPKVYQETSEMRSAPGGIRETRRTVRDSDSGLEQMSIGHHIRERAHIMQRSRNHRTGDQEERQDYINMDESDAAAFDDEWRRETSRFRPQRGLEYRRHEGSSRRAEGTRLAIQGPEDSPSRQSRRYDW